MATRLVTRPYRTWTDDDSATLRELAAAGASYSSAGRAMDREKSTIRKAALKLGLVMAHTPPPAYAVTIAEVFGALEAGPRTAADIAESFGANQSRVAGLLSALLRQGRVKQTKHDGRWSHGMEPPPPPPPPTVVFDREYRLEPDEVEVLRTLRRVGSTVCGACECYDGPLVKPPGGQLRGTCRRLGVFVVPASPEHPCGSGFTG